MNTIKTLRIRLGVTQSVFASGIGCTQGNIGHYENSGQTIPPETAKRIIAFAMERGVEIGYEDIYGPAIVSPPQPVAQAAAEQGV